MQILSTKLSVPPLRSKLVSRPWLIQKLDRAVECGFVLISAPAGYGKSTLLSAWLSRSSFPTVWYSLDEGDNDLACFLTYLAVAIGKIAPSVGDVLASALQSTPLPAVETLLTPLVNQLAQAKIPFWLVLDDYHLIQNQEVHQTIRFLLEQRPTILHLAIATRADPPLPISRLRARSAMVELRLADLCFSLEEANNFFIHTMGVKISPQDVAVITARTEGWIAGLQMAAISMQNSQDVSGLFTSFTGKNRHVFDYLLEEILGQQSAETRDFLLKTSPLEQFTAPLCDALLSTTEGSYQTRRSSSAILEDLERTNLFIIPLDCQRGWYRYHSLFADMLHSYLQQTHPEWIPALHARASDWFEEQGRVAEAIRYALAGDEWDRVLRLLSPNVLALLEQNELSSLSRQLDSKTNGTDSTRPWLTIGRAWLAAYLGQLNSTAQLLDSAEAEARSSPGRADQQTLSGHCAAVRAFTAWIEGKRDLAAQAAREALTRLHPTDYSTRCQSATILGMSQADPDESSRAFELALAYAGKIGASHVAIFAHGCWAYLLYIRGRLREAYDACHEAVRLAQSAETYQPLPTLSHIYGTLSAILREWNDMEGCLRYAREAVALAHRWGQADALHFAYTNLGNALFATGNVEGAFDILNQAWEVAHRTSPWFEEITIAQEVEWHVTQENLENALQRLSLAHIDVNDCSHMPLTVFMWTIPVQIFLAQRQPVKALAVIGAHLDHLKKRKVDYLLVNILAWQALAYHELGQKSDALTSIQQALTLAAPEGYVNTFALGRGALLPVLYQARAAGIMPEYVDKLLVSIKLPGPLVETREIKGTSPLVDPLSEREMDVLKLLSEGFSDKKIAAALVIARGTVHKHLRNIYDKLEVHSRVEAIFCAHRLGLL